VATEEGPLGAGAWWYTKEQLEGGVTLCNSGRRLAIKWARLVRGMAARITHLRGPTREAYGLAAGSVWRQICNANEILQVSPWNGKPTGGRIFIPPCSLALLSSGQSFSP